MSRRDKVDRIGRSLIQHGPLSDRVHLMRLDPADCPRIIGQMRVLAATKGYSKIFAKVPASLVSHFHGAGYADEAVVPRLFPAPGGGREPGHFLGLYLAPWRSHEPRQALVEDVLQASRTAARTSARNPEPGAPLGEVRRLDPDAAGEMAALYNRVFATYPTPLHDPQYIRQAMAGHTAWFGLRRDGALAALGSCDMDQALGQVEMTDLAVAPRARGAGLAIRILARMEQAMARAGLRKAYAIVRGTSYAANISFARLGFAHAGTLPRNTNISGALESMHVWHKPLDRNAGTGAPAAS